MSQKSECKALATDLQADGHNELQKQLCCSKVVLYICKFYVRLKREQESDKEREINHYFPAIDQC